VKDGEVSAIDQDAASRADEDPAAGAGAEPLDVVAELWRSR
jgi:hypothetical protein